MPSKFASRREAFTFVLGDYAVSAPADSSLRKTVRIVTTFEYYLDK